MHEIIVNCFSPAAERLDRHFIQRAARLKQWLQ
jgi:hypothetical protein